MKTESPKEVLLGARVDRMVGAAAAAAAAISGAGLVGTTECADAAIVYSGPVNIVIPNNDAGIYMNLVTGATGAAPVAGWDINPYSASATGFNLWGATTTTWMFTGPAVAEGNYVHLLDTVVNAASSFGRPGSSVNVGTQVALSAGNFFGVQFTNESTSAVNFGWVRIAFGATASERAITGYAYEDTGAGINIAAVPEPSVLGLLATGAFGLFAARRRRAAAG